MVLQGTILSVLVGCRVHDGLVGAKVIGGSPEQRSAVIHELDAFENWIGPERFVLERVRIGDVEGPYWGLASGRRIQLSDRLQHPLAIRLVARHELCHLLDFEEGLSSKPPFDELRPSAVRQDRDVASAQQEGFAEVCELGPLAASVLSTSCLGEPKAPSLIARAMLDDVWSSFDPPPPVPLDKPISMSLPPSPTDWGYSGLAVGSSPDGRLLSIVVTVELPTDPSWDGRSKWVVERDTGEVVSRDRLPDVVFPEPVPSEALPTGLAGISGQLDARNGGAVVGTWQLPMGEFGDFERLIALADDRWSQLDDGCPRSSTGTLRQPFAADGAWLASLEDNQVAWRRLASGRR